MRKQLPAIAAMVLLAASVAIADTRTWTGTNSGSWSDPANWGGTLPSAGDDLYFPEGAAHPVMANDLALGFQIRSLVFQSSTTTYAILGNALSLGAGGIATAALGGGLSHSIAAPVILNDGTTAMNISGPLTISGTIGGTGGIAKTGIGTLTLTGDNTYVGTTTINEGVVLVNGSQPGSAVVVETRADRAYGFWGTGTVGPVTVVSGFVNPPFGRVGVLAVTGDVIMSKASAMYPILASPTPGSGCPLVSASGEVLLDGVLYTSLNPNSEKGSVYKLVTGAGGITGSFENVAEGETVVGNAHHRLLASYAADGGQSMTLTDLGIDPRVSLSAAPAASCQGQAVTLTATLPDPGFGIPFGTGTVTFKDGGTVLGSAPLDAGIATLVVSDLSVGAHAISAEYPGDSRYMEGSASIEGGFVVGSPLGALVVNVSSQVCASSSGNLASVADAGAGAAYAWQVANGAITAGDGSREISFTAGATGTVGLSVTVTPAGGCAPANATTSVVVTALPAAPTATSNSPLAEGATINLSTPGRTGATYAWTGPNGFTSTQQNPTITNAAAVHAGTYSVTVTVDGCTSPPGSTVVVVVLTQTLSVTRDGSGTGSVFSTPLGINCGATCSASFAPGTVVTLTAVPDAGSTFAGWTGGGCSGTGTCTVAMTSAQAVTATFTLAPVLPAITSFTATPSVRTSAGVSTLAWTTTGATSVAISGLGGTFALSGTRDVSVAATTTYTLTAANAAGSVTATATVNVLPGAGTSLGTPVITAPSAGQIVSVAGVGFTWNAVSSAAGYDVKLYSATSGATVFAGSLVGNASTSTLVTLPDGAYLFAVRACNASGFANSNCGAFATRSFSVAKTAPTTAPTVTAPAQGAVLTASTQTFSWTAVPKVDPGLSLSYEVLLTDVAGGNIPDLQITVPDPTLSTIYTLHSTALYELKVRACQAGCGPWSTPVTFSVDLPDVPTTAPSVPTCSVSGGNSLTCSWSAVSGADVYSFYVVQPTGGPGGGALSVAARLVSTTTVTLPVPQGFANVIVAACTGDGCGPYSEARGINPSGPDPALPNLGTPLAASVVNGPGVEFAWNRIPGDDGTNTWYRLYVQDLSRQAAALDVYTRDNFYAAYFKAEGARYDALVVANPGASQVVGPPIGFNVRGLSASAPTMVSPPHQSQVQAGNLQLGWSPVPNASLYQYWVAVLGQGTPAVTGVTPGLVVQVPLPAVNGQPTTYSGITRACMAPTGCSPASDTGWGPWSNAPGGPGVTNFTVVP